MFCSYFYTYSLPNQITNIIKLSSLKRYRKHFANKQPTSSKGFYLKSTADKEIDQTSCIKGTCLSRSNKAFASETVANELFNYTSSSISLVFRIDVQNPQWKLNFEELDI